MLLRGGVFALLTLLALGWPSALRAAEPVAELGSFSAFPQLDLNKLAGGKVLTARGALADSPRDLSVQAVYLVPAPVGKTVELHRQWDPARHPELKVWLHGDIGGKPSAGDFAKLSSAPSNGAVRGLASATQKLPEKGALQLSNAEAQEFSKASGGAGGALPGPVAAFWTHVLLNRASAFAGKGLSGQPPYEFGNGSARPAEEVSRLLKGQPKVRGQFRSLIEATPLGGGAGSLSPQLYWELFDVEGEGALSLGASYAKEGGETAQMVDLQYYASGGYYVYLTLYQMWAVTSEGKPATLVWRGDSLASQALSELRGMEKMGSGAAMMKEVQRAINLFQKDSR